MDTRYHLLLLIGLALVGLTRCCTHEVMVCQDTFTARTQITRETLEHGIITEMTAERLTDICSAFEVMTDCMDLHSCDISFRLHINGLIKMYTYICNEGFQDHVNHADCIGKNETIPGTEACYTALETKLSDYLITRVQACKVITGGLDCMERVVNGVCSKEAAKHRRDIESIFLQPTAELFLCPLNISTANTGTATDKRTSVTRISSGTTPQPPVIGEVKEKDDDNGLSKSEAVGITFCVTVLGAVVIAAILYFVLRRRNKEQLTDNKSALQILALRMHNRK